jgi:glutathione reductase (NADPH)
VKTTDMVGWLNARTYAETTAWAKIIVENGSDRIVGAHLLGHSGSELIHLFAFAMAHGISAGQMRETVYAFPTFASDIRNLL